MKTGVVTTDSNTGATPSGYTAHTSARGNADDISAQQLALDDISFIWSANSDVTTEVDCAANGYTYVDTLDEFNALTPSDKSFGQFGDDTWMLDPESDSPNLEEMVTKAIATLSTNNTKGFFLMVEGAHIDKMSHKNDVEGAAEAVEEFDKAVKIALDFAKADGNTLVVITADHETGAIKETNGDYVYTSGSHSSANVPLLVYGCDNFIDQGEAVKNRNIPCYIASALNIENAFPRKIAA